MRIVSLAPYLTELVSYFGCAPNLVGITQSCVLPTIDKKQSPPIPAPPEPHRISSKPPPTDQTFTHSEMDFEAFSINEIKSLNPDLVLIPVKHADNPKLGTELTAQLSGLIGKPVKVNAFAPHTLALTYQMFEQLATSCGVAAKGHALVQRVTAQSMDWGDNFYDRTKNKRVTMLSSITPLRLAGLWFPDLIHLASCVAQENVAGVPHREVTWQQVCDFKPDVIIVAPEGYTLKETMQTFKLLEKQPAWETLPAVKRGEVIFLEGKEAMYNPTQRLTDALAFIFSSIAGFESGYITPRESFYRLRWIELQRHRLD